MRLKMATLFKVSDTCADSRERLPYHGGFHGKDFFTMKVQPTRNKSGQVVGDDPC